MGTVGIPVQYLLAALFFRRVALRIQHIEEAMLVYCPDHIHNGFWNPESLQSMQHCV